MGAQAAPEALAAPQVCDGGFDPVAYINEPRWHTSRLGLERIRELLDRLGNPQDGLRFVHVAGTNGKGSTCAFLESILRHAGYCTGLFTSPYIIEFSDRIKVDGQNVPEDDLLRATLEVRDAAERMEDHPTEFELMTAVAMLHFRNRACDIVVLEVGLGGRFDSTNVIRNPLACVISPIDLDHTGILGDTVAQIAAEKAGIVKDAAPVASAVQLASAEEVIRRACERCESPLSFVDADSIQGTPWDFSYKDLEHLRLGMIGSYQTENAALAIETVGLLRAQGFSIPDPAIREGLAQTRWPGRFELVSENPAVIVDGGHNPQGARALADSLRLGFPGKKAVFVMGVLADKDSRQMVCPLLDLAQAFVCVEPPNPRALPAGELAALLQDACARREPIPVECADGFEDALRRAFALAGEDGIVCACGSLYSVASVMEGLRSLKTMRC